MKKKNSDLNALKWIIEVLGSDIKYVWYLTIVKCGLGVEGTVFALVLKRVTNCALNKDMVGLYHNLKVIIGIVLIAIVCYVLSIYLKEAGNAHIEKRFRAEITTELLTKEYGYITSKHVGEWISRIIGDTTQIYQVILEVFPNFIGTIVQFICASGALLFTNLSISAAFLIGGIILVVFSIMLRKRLKEFQKFVVNRDAQYRSMLTEKLSGMIIIKSYSLENKVVDLLNEKSDKLIEAKMKRTKFTTLCSSCMYIAMRIAYVAGVCLFGYLILKGQVEYGDMIANLQIITLIITPISNISSYIPQFYNAITSAERIMEIDEGKQDYFEEIISLKDVTTYYQNKFKSIVINNGKFAYTHDNNDYETNIINNFNLEINKGEIVALIGKSGCGKSTVMKILMNLYSLDEGECFFLDKENNKTKVSSAWRNMYAYVPQGNYLESGKVRDVITFFDPELSKNDEKIWEVLKLVCADDFISKMPNGLDYELLERGTGLSEGQIQRLAIARAILSNRPILLLDECTSSLDEITEAKVLENLKTKTDCTVILITHRPYALSICNKVVEL